MTHVAHQRIKMGGTYYAPGDPIAPSEDDLKDLPKGAVSLASDEGTSKPEPSMLSEDQIDRLKASVAKLNSSAFKQDGEIRAGALKGLNDQLDFDVSVEAVAALKAGV